MQINSEIHNVIKTISGHSNYAKLLLHHRRWPFSLLFASHILAPEKRVIICINSIKIMCLSYLKPKTEILESTDTGICRSESMINSNGLIDYWRVWDIRHTKKQLPVDVDGNQWVHVMHFPNHKIVKKSVSQPASQSVGFYVLQ